MLNMYKLTARYKLFPRLNIGELAVIVASIVATLITIVFGCENKIAGHQPREFASLEKTFFDTLHRILPGNPSND